MKRIFLILLMMLIFSLSALIDLSGFSIYFIYLTLVILLGAIYIFLVLSNQIKVNFMRNITVDKIFYFIFIFSLLITILKIQSTNNKIEYIILFLIVPIFIVFVSKDLILKHKKDLPLLIFLGATPNLIALFASDKIKDNIIILYGDIIFTSRIFGLIAILSLYLIFKQRKYFIIYSITFVISLYVVFQSGSRQVILAIILASFFLVAFKINSKYLVKYFVNILIFIGLGSIIFVVFKEMINFNELYIVKRWILQGADSSGRDTIISLSIEQFLNLGLKEIFSGIGFGMYQLYIGNLIFAYPHNIFLEFLIEGGIILALVLVIYCINIIWKYYRFRGMYSESHMTMLFFIFLYFLIVANFSASIPGNNFLFFIIAILSICFNEQKSYLKENI